MDLTEAEDIKKRWQEYTELYKKDLHNPDNHDDVITNLEPDILECEVKWDLESITKLGCLGFIKAVDGFDLQFGTQFSTYAVPKISGEIRRFLRDDGTVKVSRSIKERSFYIKNVRTELSASLLREPTVFEISEKTGLTPEEIAEADSATAAVESLSGATKDDGFSLEYVLSDTDSEDDILEHLTLRQALEKLPEREAMVIKLRYYHGLTQDRVSKVLSVSQVQVSRIEKKALSKLKEMML